MIWASIVLILIEAALDVAKGDLHDLNSHLRILRDALIVSAVGLAFGVIYGALLYLALRFVFFDYIYSYFRFGHIWYLGKTSATDQVLKKINPYLLLGVRFLIILALIFTL